jgi:hypothetical protein
LRDTLLLGRPVPWAGQGKDLVSTILWPTLLMLLARYTQVLRRR